MTEPTAIPRASSPPARLLLDKLTAVSVWGYLLALLLLWFTMALGGDRWWLATVILFSPRWIYALPLAVLVPLALRRRRRLLFVLAAALAVWAGPIADGRIAWPSRGDDRPGLRVLSCNVQQWKGESQDALCALIKELKPDVVALQEHWGEVPPLWPNTWHVRRGGDLLIASPHPLGDSGPDSCVVRGMHSNHVDVLCCLVRAPIGNIRFANLHLTTPREGLERVLSRCTILKISQRHQLTEMIDFRRRQSRTAHEFAVGNFGADILAGDFNMPVASSIYRECWSGLQNAFDAVGWGFGYTKHTEISGMTYGLRIDHILAGSHWQPLRCWVERDVHSDHLPLLADLAFDPLPK